MDRGDPQISVAELQRRLAEHKLMPKPVRNVASRRQRWPLERDTATVMDPDGVRWTVYRRWVPIWAGANLSSAQEAGLILVLLQVLVLWPPWFIAKWLGVRWRIVIVRNGTKVGEVRVRGWRKSRRRIEAIAESAAAGTLQLPAS